LNPKTPQILPIQVPSPQTNGHAIPVQANIQPGISSATLSNVSLFYKDALSPTFQSVLMSGPNGGGIFSADIPAQPGNNFVQYYFSATDQKGNSGTSPIFEPQTSPYRFAVQLDLTPPTVISVNPPAHATQVSLAPLIQATFSK